MSSKTKIASIALGSSLAIASMGALAAGAENPFSSSTLSSGYQIAASDKAGEAKCGAKGDKKEEAKCGAKDDKKGEASCGGKK